MKVILQKDVKNLGRTGDLVNVSTGYARNFLFPRQLALGATEERVKEFEHLKKMADAKKKKAHGERKALLQKITGKTLTFKAQAGDTDKLFGSITNKDISDRLSADGFEVDKRDIHIEEPIRMLGQHKATLKLGEDLSGEITISVERTEEAGQN